MIADRLQLSPMVATNRDPMRTAFTVSVDYQIGLTTGISAEERTNTLRALANDNCIATDFLRPGHVFPLVSKTGGVLIRSGHTEAATDLCRLAGLPQVGVLAEIVNDDGTVKRLPGARRLCAGAQPEDRLDRRPDRAPDAHRILRAPHREHAGHDARSARRQSTSTRRSFDDTQHLAVAFGDVAGKSGVACRIHHEQPLRDLFDAPSSQRWLDVALERFRASGSGVLIYVRDPKITTLESTARDERRDAGGGRPAQQLAQAPRALARGRARRADPARPRRLLHHRSSPPSTGNMSASPASASRSPERSSSRAETLR